MLQEEMVQNSDEEKELPTSPRNRTHGSYLSRSRRRQSSSSSKSVLDNKSPTQLVGVVGHYQLRSAKPNYSFGILDIVCNVTKTHII